MLRLISPFVIPLKLIARCRLRTARPTFVQRAHKKLICCLLALEIADYKAKPIFDQVRLTQDFHNLLSDATRGATSQDLVSIVEEDGALLAFLCDPEDCFRAALAIHEATLTDDCYRDLQLRIGIDLGKAGIAEDELGHPVVTGQGRQDADRLMRQGPPRQISVSRRFVELLSRNAPELAELLEYQGLYSDSMGSLQWYRTPAVQDIASEGLSDGPATPALPSEPIDTPMQSKLAPIAIFAQWIAKFQGWLRHPRLRYALLLLVVGAALVAFLIRVGVSPSALKPTAQVAVVTPQSTVPQPPESLPTPEESLVGHPAEPLLESLAPQEGIGPTTTLPPEFVKDLGKPDSAASLLSEPIEEPALVEQRAQSKVDSAAAPERKQKRSKRQSQNTPGKEPQLPAQGEATADPMLTCARIEVLAKRLECFDKLKRSNAAQTGSAGKG